MPAGSRRHHGPLPRLGRLQRDRWSDRRELAHAINGTVVGGAVMVAASEHGRLGEVVVTVVATLLVYWAVERYSEALAAGVAGQGPVRGRVLEALRRGWPMLQASYTPLLTLLVASALGADLRTAVLVALTASTVLLAALGSYAAHNAGASRAGVLGWAAVSAALGIVVIGLKLTLH